MRIFRDMSTRSGLDRTVARTVDVADRERPVEMTVEWSEDAERVTQYVDQHPESFAGRWVVAGRHRTVAHTRTCWLSAALERIERPRVLHLHTDFDPGWSAQARSSHGIFQIRIVGEGVSFIDGREPV